MTHKQLSITLLAFLLSATASLPIAAAAKQEAPPSQSVTGKIVGKVSCQVSSIEKNADGTLKKCVLTENKTIPGADFTCSANKPMTLDAEGNLAQCTLAFDRSYPDPVGVVCDDGHTIDVYPNGNLAKCTAATPKTAILVGGTCAVNQPVEFYSDGQLKECTSVTGRKITETNTKEVYISELTCAPNSVVAIHPNGKVAKCTPTDAVFMRGKGTCLANEQILLHPDGKVQECTYTYPLYQNRSCKVEDRASFHPNGNFKDCTLPDDKQVGKALCKADSPVSYRADGTVASCTLAAPAEQAPGKVIPAGAVVTIDEKLVLTEKPGTAPVKPTPPAPPAATAKPAATPEKPAATPEKK